MTMNPTGRGGTDGKGSAGSVQRWGAGHHHYHHGDRAARADETDIAALRPLLPVLLSYVLSFVFLGIYWNNHHHMLHLTRRVTGAILWANLHLLFWLSLVPFVAAWMGQHPFASTPAALYGVVLLMAGIAYLILQRQILRSEGPDSVLALALGRDVKGTISPLLCALAIGGAFVHPGIAYCVYLIIALIWLIPDRRIERAMSDGSRRS